MIRSLFRFYAPVTILALALMTVSLQAQPAPTIDLLRQAYGTLAVANHNYDGHRVRAMQEIEIAARSLRMGLRGDAWVRQPQLVSNEQLRIARGMLAQAGAGLRGSARRHVDRAISQINIALRIQ